MNLKKENILGVFLFIACTLSIVLILSALQSSQNFQTQSAPTQPPTRAASYAISAPAPVDLQLYSPISATFDMNKTILVYEIYLGNLSPATIEKVEVFADSPAGTPIKTLQGQELEAAYLSKVPPMVYQDVFLWLEFPQGTPIPSTLYHKISIKSISSASAIGNAPTSPVITTNTLTPEPVRVRNTTLKDSPIAVIGPPVKGDKWIMSNGPSNTVGHRRAVFMFNGKPLIAQRYAIDFLQYGPNNLVYKTDGKTNDDFYCYGADLIAVADGVVVDTKDGIPDNVPGVIPPATMATLAGNYVVLDIGNGHNALYAHIIPGSVNVKIGDHVKKGDVIGKLGSSGNSGAPHLHFHMISSKDAVLSDGEPYAFESYYLEAANPDWVKNVYSPFTGWYASPILMNRTMPVDGDIVGFPSAQ